MNNCKNCGTELKGKYCYACGEKLIEENDRKFTVILKEFLNSFTFYDSKALKSLWLLAAKPGKLTSEYIEGRRKAYFKPIQLFLLLNLVYFLLPTWDIFFTKLGAHLSFFFYSNWATDLVNARIQALGISYTEYESIFNAHEKSYANILIILNIFIFSVFVWLVNIGNKRFYFSDHFVYATHFFSFLIFIMLLIIPTLFYMIGFLFNERLVFLDDNAYSILSGLILSTYLIISYRKVYQQKWGWAVLKGLLLLIGFVITTIILYRFILFLVTYWLV